VDASIALAVAGASRRVDVAVSTSDRVDHHPVLSVFDVSARVVEVVSNG
jgi:hypothetical protein